MRRFFKVSLVAVLFLACCTTMLGYASFTSYLEVFGTAEHKPPQTLHVTGVTAGDVGEFDAENAFYSGCVVTTSITLEKVGNAWSAKYLVDFWNNTPDTYYYLAMVHGTFTDENGIQTAYSNPNVVLTPDIALGDEIAAGAHRTITVTATFARGADTSDATLASTIEYQFTTEKPENNDQAAVSGVVGRFPEILNDPETMETLIGALDANSTHPDYIGNVVGFLGLNNDVQTVEDLFGVALELNVDGENKPVTVVIQRANVDNNEATGETYTYNQSTWTGTKEVTAKGCEMILFMTATDLDSVSGGSYVDVYAIVFTKDEGGSEWYQKGDMYLGSARAVGYLLGSTLAHDSFNPSTWRQLDANGNRTDTTLSDIITALP